MATIPTWAIGKHVTAVTVTPQTVSVAGLLADTTPVMNFVGAWDSVSIASENTVENIQAADQRHGNNVITQTDTTVEVAEILKTNDSSGTPTNLLAALAYGSADYFKATLTRAGRTFTFYGVMRSYREEYARGKQLGRAVIDMVDPGTANPTYV